VFIKNCFVFVSLVLSHDFLVFFCFCLFFVSGWQTTSFSKCMGLKGKGRVEKEKGGAFGGWIKAGMKTTNMGSAKANSKSTEPEKDEEKKIGGSWTPRQGNWAPKNEVRGEGVKLEPNATNARKQRNAEERESTPRCDWNGWSKRPEGGANEGEKPVENGKGWVGLLGWVREASGGGVSGVVWWGGN